MGRDIACVRVKLTRIRIFKMRESHFRLAISSVFLLSAALLVGVPCSRRKVVSSWPRSLTRVHF